jgi:competence protein ComGF
MLIKILPALIFLVSAATTAMAEVDFKEYKIVRNTKEFKLYLKGVGEGLAWANEELAARGSKALYCKPEKEVIGIEQYSDILKKEVNENAAEIPDDMPLGLILLNGLIKSFPCK